MYFLALLLLPKLLYSLELNLICTNDNINNKEVDVKDIFLLLDSNKKKIELGGLSFFADQISITNSNVSWTASDIKLYPDSNGESGDNFISEVGIVSNTTVEVEIQAPDSFPHGVRDNAQIIFSDGETGQVVQAGSQYDEGDGNNTFQQYLLQVDYGSILLETEDASIDESLTGNDATSYLLDEVDGDRIKRDFGDSTPRTYTIRYGRDSRSLDDEGVLKMETCQVEHSANNDYFGGRVDHFMINGFKSRLAPFGTMQIHEIDKIFGG